MKIQMAQTKLENSHLVIKINWNRKGLRSLVIAFMLPFLLSSCQPVAAGFVGVSFGIFMLIAIMSMGAFGIRLETNKSIYTKPSIGLNTQSIINKN
jgi:membrane protein DedA with SNARE-associated domain